MAKIYTKEERAEALKLAEEISVAAAARRLGMNENTIYGWKNRANKEKLVFWNYQRNQSRLGG